MRSNNPATPTDAQRSGSLRSRACLGPYRRGVGLALEDLQCQTSRGVLGDVAVHEPRAWVVGLEGDDDEAVGGQQHDVAPRRAQPVHPHVGRGVDCVFCLLEDGEVVAV